MNRRLKVSLQILSASLFGLILWWGGTEPWRQILSGDPRFVLAAFFLRGLAGMTAAWRLRMITIALSNRPPISWRRLYYLTMTTRALALIVPQSVSSIGGKSVVLRSFGVSLKRAFLIVMVDNVFDVLLLSVLTLPSWLFLRGRIGAMGWVTAVLVAILVTAAALWWGTAANRMAVLRQEAFKLPWLGPRLQQIVDVNHTIFPAPPQSLSSLGWTILLNGFIASSFYFIGRAVDVSAAIPTYLAGFPFAQLSLVAAVTPGGLGLFDLGWLGLLRLGGVSPGESLTFVIAQRAYIYPFVLVWAGFSVLLSSTVKSKPPTQ